MLPKINLREIRRTLRHIEKDIRRFKMNFYGVQKGTKAAQLYSLDDSNFAPCNTKACFAGWCVLNNTPKQRWNKLFEFDGAMDNETTLNKARKIVGFTEEEAELVFANSFRVSDTPKKQLRQVKAAINRVLKNRGSRARV